MDAKEILRRMNGQIANHPLIAAEMGLTGANDDK